MPKRELNALISQKIIVTSELIILRVVPDSWKLPEFKAGQYTVLGLPGNTPRYFLSDLEGVAPNPEKMILRAYSIASSSRRLQYLEFYITLVRSGELTPRIFALEPGDRIHLGNKITGMFTLDQVPVENHIILMATGTGLAPYMSMIRSVLVPNDARQFAILHGAWHSWDLGYRSELTTLDIMMNNFHYIPVIGAADKETIPWGGETGYVQQAWERGIILEKWGFDPTPENTHVFLCGNPSMIEGALKMLSGLGFQEDNRQQDGQIHLEKYW